MFCAFTGSRYQVGVYRTIGPLVIICCLLYRYVPVMYSRQRQDVPSDVCVISRHESPNEKLQRQHHGDVK